MLTRTIVLISLQWRTITFVQCYYTQCAS